MAEKKSCSFAVCPSVETWPPVGEPKLFDSLQDAERFLESQPELSLESLGAEERIAEYRQTRAFRQKQLCELLAAAGVKAEQLSEVDPEVKPLPTIRFTTQDGSEEEISLWHFSDLFPSRNRDRGWLDDPIPIVCLASHNGPKGKLTFREYFPKAGKMTDLTDDDYIDLLESDRTSAVYLDSDWDFGLIEENARAGEGHTYQGRRYERIGDIVVSAVYDLDEAIRRMHPKAPNSAIVDFLRSWQVQRHIAEFCAQLVVSGTAFNLACGESEAVRKIYAEKEARNAWLHLRTQLSRYFTHIVPNGNEHVATPGSTGAGVPAEPSRRGPKPNHEAAQRAAEIVGRIAQGQRWQEKWEEICEEFDKAEIPPPRTWRKRFGGVYGWTACDEKPIAVHAIKRQLKLAREKPPTETPA